ncbi:MAG: hypothetical protein WCC95_01425 [Candidatus Sulfotelmatobacter sp.]|jgi:hypothetical protein
MDMIPDRPQRPLREALRTAWHRGRSLLPRQGFLFARPLIVLQSDDWGRVGVRDAECWQQLRTAGVNLGQHPYDFYSLETADDVEAVASVLSRHRDSSGRPACLGMNFVPANIDFAKVSGGNFSEIHIRPLAEGLPDGWNRPGLMAAYRSGISSGLFSASLHGLTHFCRTSAERYLSDAGERGNLLRTLWSAGVPYIHWRMPWMGFEYADRQPDGGETFLSSTIQESLIEEAVAAFTRLFSIPPRSACAPGYRADRNTHHAWAKNGIRVAQNGPGTLTPPHFGSDPKSNGLLHLYRTIDFEPAVAEKFSLESCLKSAEQSLARGLPVIVSVHSINFHSSLRDFRSRTLTLLDEFLSAMELKHPDFLYVRDEDLYDLVETGKFESMQAAVRVPVKKKAFAGNLLVAMGRS